MTLEEIILESLKQFDQPMSANDISDYMLKNNLWKTDGKTPSNTVSARLGKLSKEDGSRVKREWKGNKYYFYLLKEEQKSDSEPICQEEATDNNCKTIANKDMTVTEAILKSLEQFDKPVKATDISDYILKNNLWKTNGATPSATIQSRLGDFIRANDNRVKRMKGEDDVYLYYYSKNEQALNYQYKLFPQEKVAGGNCKTNKESYKERDLHVLLTTYLSIDDIHVKTIFHEVSNRKDENQKWTHPDMVGIRLLSLQTTPSQNILKAVAKVETFKIFSYELKREINSDYELKKAYFQAVSNSSWANYGYLVAFEISDALRDEIERLNQSFGIGVILLKANPHQSKIMYPARYKSIDFKTVDKLCLNNKNFEVFIDKMERLLNAPNEYYGAIKKDLLDFCDKPIEGDKEIKDYCKVHHISFEEESE